jgi:hypothetical protein
MENGEFMPTPYIKKVSKETGKSIKSLEKKWDTAVAKAAEAGHAEDYAYITGIFKNMIKKKKKSVSKEDIDSTPIYASW